ncbi:unnamed protein product [Cylindrotheca closterium]|uniref:Uncharacterized protein n=1 Tax=Cylindrotheca closterium TaxID=2856 RepID=A0AAD2FX28_9STRA|nr:unnamed protein product [Cylindrotheca closterium]
MTSQFKDMFDLVGESDRIVIHDNSSNVLYSSTEKAELISLQQALHQCLEKPLFHSHGINSGNNPTITLYRNGEELLQISHHSSCKSIECSLYSFDIPLSKAQTWLEWFDHNNVNSPRQEFERLAARRREQRETYKTFMRNMPPYLLSIWKKHESTIRFDGKCPDDLKRSLRRNLCGKTLDEKIADVLIWYGTTASAKNRGSPIYERAVEALLLAFDEQDIESAVESQFNEQGTLSNPNLITGCYKLFRSFRFKKMYPEGLNLESIRQPQLLGVTF